MQEGRGGSLLGGESPKGGSLFLPVKRKKTKKEGKSSKKQLPKFRKKEQPTKKEQTLSMNYVPGQKKHSRRDSLSISRKRGT